MPIKPTRKTFKINERFANKNKSWNSTDFSYSSRQWIKLRDLKKALSPLCEECLKLGIIQPWVHSQSVIDHIIPVANNIELAFDIDNLQHLCKSHHGIKSGKEAAQRRKNKMK